MVSTPQMSVQLYSVREALDSDLEGTLARLASLGFRNVEPFDFVRRADALAPVLRANGLAAPTGHATILTSEFRHDGQVYPVPSHDETFAAAEKLGLTTVIDAFVPPERWADEAEIARTAQLINEAAVEAAAHGLRVGYHNHDHEFAHSFDGVTAYELFVSQLDPAVVLELDAYWAFVGGQDVPALLERLGDRVVAIHVKDGVVDAAASHEETVAAQQPAGEGDVPVAAILDAAPGVEYDVLEFDSYAGDIFDGLAQGVAFLGERGVR
jgi:sugar phosphate isomerase/epimerase